MCPNPKPAAHLTQRRHGRVSKKNRPNAIQDSKRTLIACDVRSQLRERECFHKPALCTRVATSQSCQHLAFNVSLSANVRSRRNTKRGNIPKRNPRTFKISKFPHYSSILPPLCVQRFPFQTHHWARTLLKTIEPVKNYSRVPFFSYAERALDGQTSKKL